jgi:CRP-like cAMP-binding protein
MALLAHRPHLHAVTAATKCRLMILDKDDFDLLCMRLPNLFRTVREIAEQRSRMGGEESV